MPSQPLQMPPLTTKPDTSKPQDPGDLMQPDQHMEDSTCNSPSVKQDKE